MNQRLSGQNECVMRFGRNPSGRSDFSASPRHAPLVCEEPAGAVPRVVSSRIFDLDQWGVFAACYDNFGHGHGF